jgi:hypothetical protein
MVHDGASLSMKAYLCEPGVSSADRTSDQRPGAATPGASAIIRAAGFVASPTYSPVLRPCPHKFPAREPSRSSRRRMARHLALCAEIMSRFDTRPQETSLPTR